MEGIIELDKSLLSRFWWTNEFRKWFSMNTKSVKEIIKSSTSEHLSVWTLIKMGLPDDIHHLM